MVIDTLVSQSTMDFAYSQFNVFDPEADSLGVDWTQSHFDQGFARRDSFVSFGTIAEFGIAKISVYLGPLHDVNKYDRVIQVPFMSSSGIVTIEGPEEVNLVERFVNITPGCYSLVAAQHVMQADTDANCDEEIELYFDLLDVPIVNIKILKADATLSHISSLIEDVDPPF